MGTPESKIHAGITMLHYGKYQTWNRTSKKLPDIQHISHDIEAHINTEFGYTLLIKGLKGKTISFVIQHPPFKDDNGNISPDFTGEVFINSNSFTFYLGDCVWEPIHDKIGPWRLLSYIEGVCIADKTLYIYQKNDYDDDILDW
ncbi:MAG: DUF3859 domain-containing protein [Bacteroidales bacterium]